MATQTVAAEVVDLKKHPTLGVLVDTLEQYLPADDCDQVLAAYEYAREKHEGHMRRSGHPYIEHPLAAAITCAELQLDVPAVQAALLHDVMEDCGVSRAQLVSEFGVDVAKLVEGATKLSALQLPRVTGAIDREVQAENLRKMFVAMADDVRVVIVKLADRLHNMRTLDAMRADQQVRISRETMDIYAPLAARLGIWQIRAQLEDLSFKYLEPDDYRRISDLVASRRQTRERYLGQIRVQLENALTAEGLNAQVRGRVKHLFSIHEKIKKYSAQGKSFDDIYDLLALRVLTETTGDCYAVLGVVHGLWRPLAGEFDDYIASPRPSGYQSLHTTAFWSASHAVEVQIRTHQMDREAEYGVAVHWAYKENRHNAMNDRERLSWLRQLVDWQGELAGADDFLETLRSDVFQDQVFVHTPKGEILALRTGATPLDFAFRIHTDVGYQCVGAKVNGRLARLSTPLANGDVVEIVTSRTARGPSRDWLNPALGYVTTQHARTKIRQWFNRQARTENIARGRDELDRELRRLSLRLPNVESEVMEATRAKTMDDALALIGAGDITAHAVALKVASAGEEEADLAPTVEVVEPTAPSSVEAVSVLGGTNMLTRLAPCCSPQVGEAITGFITRSRGVTIHRQDCPNIVSLVDDERIVPVRWNTFRGLTEARLRVTGWDRVGLARDVAGVCADENVNMVSFVTGEPDRGAVTLTFTVEANGLRQLQRVMSKLDGVHGVMSVERDH
ncbi:MAG: bifunctional (p)ppGpp synthetase/guanosine-3',5'-bis(diphosphate) 3'-pyrophosphohydrolase [Chloroflexi bacterium]|nr:bifunctional (p)ppGpp synthetase/guanosine-3',5'-bis(diphosphate) 3'-pyrophosphohydrolase [Chloroflexota bacterium]MXX80887.1 bifunctional (p)ppGpp synthetase/guanosine-3',5'-bis(diphosphate) 3'-pyrophosphohydrolase [Chloroflexota bacterium]MYB22064.1 bifunctional (p)ppGpp synthetase/guanosine-3',5'-bis(diphosphate) 3'-pyrophosphohydrolase [Chloroflexota bacterium]MYD17424.1 bifunctional (p)ppGpp synthetase/guanosine-3',5'-bis(diphosphate) 3'-pyrophosphohydrolase [Chloroflexota bacterium]MYF